MAVFWLGSVAVVGGSVGLLSTRGWVRATPLWHFSQRMVIRGVVVFVSRVVAIGSVVVYVFTPVVFPFRFLFGVVPGAAPV